MSNPIISKTLIAEYLTQVKFYDVKKVKSFTYCGNCVRVSFSTVTRSYSFNLSVKKLNIFYLDRMVRKSKELTVHSIFEDLYQVNFQSSDDNQIHGATWIDCTCPDFAFNQSKSLLGFTVCKHQIAAARHFGFNSFKDIRNEIERRQQNLDQLAS